MTKRWDEPRPEAEVPIRVQTRFERFPASIRGAFVMRGADGNPHTVRIESARMLRVPDGPDKPVAVEDRSFDVAPVLDLFVPFEVGVADVEPGWYRVECRAKVDGGKVWTFHGRLFTMPWPRSDVRRGTLPVGRTAVARGVSFDIDRVELTGDSSTVVWRPRAEDQAPAWAALLADGSELPALPDEASPRASEPAAGERRSMGYPVPRACRSLAVVLRLASGERSEPVPVPLG